MTRPNLNQIPLPNPFPIPGKCYMTMTPGQWDWVLQEAYERNWMLLEIEVVDGEEKAVKAFQKKA
jgi:hypothetical protein